ncbi:MAG: sulfurtransferase complex subunit TusB [Thiohalomonadales bacterium]
MATLHTVNKSPMDRGSLESCVRLAAKGSSVLLIEDAVYGAMQGTVKSELVSKAMSGITFYVLAPDMEARGIAKDKLINGIETVDYAGFVDLVTKHDTTNSWL